MVHVDVTARIPLPITEYWAARITPEFLSIETKVLKNASKVISKTDLAEDGVTVKFHEMKTKPDLSTVPSMLMAMLPAEVRVHGLLLSVLHVCASFCSPCV